MVRRSVLETAGHLTHIVAMDPSERVTSTFVRVLGGTPGHAALAHSKGEYRDTLLSHVGFYDGLVPVALGSADLEAMAGGEFVISVFRAADDYVRRTEGIDLTNFRLSAVIAGYAPSVSLDDPIRSLSAAGFDTEQLSDRVALRFRAPATVAEVPTITRAAMAAVANALSRASGDRDAYEVLLHLGLYCLTPTRLVFGSVDLDAIRGSADSWWIDL